MLNPFGLNLFAKPASRAIPFAKPSPCGILFLIFLSKLENLLRSSHQLIILCRPPFCVRPQNLVNLVLQCLSIVSDLLRPPIHTTHRSHSPTHHPLTNRSLALFYVWLYLIIFSFTSVLVIAPPRLPPPAAQPPPSAAAVARHGRLHPPRPSPHGLRVRKEAQKEAPL